MQVLMDPNAAASGQDLQSQAPKPADVQGQPPAPEHSAPEREASEKKASSASGFLQADVTYQRDSDGRVYYVVTDANSGKEVRQVPAEEVRKVGEGIEEFLKQKQAAASEHVEVKG